MIQQYTFLIDVDNTLIDNDLIKTEIWDALVSILGLVEAKHFWRHHDLYRKKTHIVDFPAIIQEYCNELDSAKCDTRVRSIFDTIDFMHALYPSALEVLDHLQSFGLVYVFTEGDAYYQKRKIIQSGICNHLKDTSHILLYEYKLDHIIELSQTFQDTHIVYIDDKDTNLQTAKKLLPHITTVVVCQGHYASEKCTMDHQADLVVGSVNELLQSTSNTFKKGFI